MKERSHVDDSIKDDDVDTAAEMFVVMMARQDIITLHTPLLIHYC